MITTYYRTLKDSKLQTVDDIRRGSWVHVQKPTEEEMAHLVEKLGLDEGLLEDANDFFEVPRFEIEDGIAYFFTRYISNVNDDMATAPILIAVGPTFVLTVTHETPTFFKPFVEGKIKAITTQKTKLFLQLMFEINQKYTGALTTMRREVRKSRKNISEITNKDIIRFLALEDTLTDFSSALVPTNTALNAILSGGHLEVKDDDHDLVEDLLLSNEQLLESTRAIEHTIINIRSTYNTIMTNNLNQVIKMLTAITIVLTIPTMVSSLFGMNVVVPFGDSPAAFIGIVALTSILAFGVAWFFSRKGWI